MLSAGASADGALARNLAGDCHFNFNERQGAGTGAAACLWPLTQWDLRRCVYGWFEAMRLDRPRPRHGGMQATGPGGLGGLRQVGIESQLVGGTGRGQRVVGEGGLGDSRDGRERHRPSCGE